MATQAYPAGSKRLSRERGSLVSAQGIPLRVELVHALAEATRDLPEGYRASMFSGADARSTGTKNHPNGVAVDLRIIDASGRALPAAGFDASLKVYEQLFQSAWIRAKHLFPGKKLAWIWGGAWISRAAGNGDRMHYQIHDPARPVRGAATASGNYDPITGIKPGTPHAAAFMSKAEMKAYQNKITEQAKMDYAAGIPSVPKTAAEALKVPTSIPTTAGTAGGIVAAGVGTAAVAHQSGVQPWIISVIVVAAVVIAVGAWFVMRARNA